MIGEEIVDAVEQLVIAAIALAELEEKVETIEYDGPPARFIFFDPATKQIVGFMMERGESIYARRDTRLLIEHVEHVRMKSPAQMIQQWAVN